jgi:hypothetical protein
VDVDWKAAVEVSSAAIYEKNPDWLIIVSGLCFSFDLRKMVHNHPDIPQTDKLVWTVHYYSFSRWWTRAEDKFQDIHESIESWDDVEALGKRMFAVSAAAAHPFHSLLPPNSLPRSLRGGCWESCSLSSARTGNLRYAPPARAKRAKKVSGSGAPTTDANNRRRRRLLR